MESSIQKVSKKEKTFISLRAHGLSVYCFRLYKDLVKMMSMYVRDEKRQDIFYSLMTGTDISDLSYRYNLSIRELIFMYEEGVREVSRCWESLVQEQQRLHPSHHWWHRYLRIHLRWYCHDGSSSDPADHRQEEKSRVIQTDNPFVISSMDAAKLL